MKKISLYVFVILMFSNFGFAQNFTYHCKLDTQFMNKGETIWRNKFINFSFKSTDNKTISIFDHEIEVTYKKKLNILSNDNRIFAITMEKSLIKTLIIDKQSNFATYSLSYTDGERTGQYGIGKCKLH
tara:strand:- start:1078 stop:1461 length:384 start_codon:yes stop_codon:yes gene_type:complete